MQLISNPLEVVQELFTKCAGVPDSGDFGVQEHFQKQLDDPQVYNQIPILTHASAQFLPNNSLVRFSGMVQDMGDPQYYYGAIQKPDGSWSTTKYGDVHDPEALASPAATKIWERRPLFCIPVPGRTKWTEEPAALPVTALTSPGAAKRPRSESGNAAAASSSDAAVQDTHMQSDQEQRPTEQEQRPTASKMAKTGSPANKTTSGTAAATQAPTADVPQPGDCIVYLYDALEGLSLHDVVEVVGVVSHTPELAAWHLDNPDQEEEPQQQQQQEEEEELMIEESQDKLSCLSLKEQKAANPPTSQVMRVHAILVKVNPSLVPPASLPVLVKTPEAQAVAGREVVLQLLTSCLGGDQLAAQYLLMNSLARVLSRVTGQGVVGPLPINLTRCPSRPRPGTTTTTTAAEVPGQHPDAGQALHCLWSSLLPLCCYLPLTIPRCNQGSGWAPRRDPETNRVSRSPLQLPQGSLLLVDEVALEEGQLSETGIKSLQAVQCILQDQALPYDFVFYSRPFPVDVSCVVLSEGRSLLHSSLNITLPLQPTQPLLSQQQVADLVSNTDPALLAVARAYLHTAAAAEYTLGDDMMAQLQSDFVAKRKSDPEFNAEAFQLQLTMARLYALSWGQGQLTKEHWSEVQQMERSRAQRCAALPRSEQANNAKREQ